MHITEEKLKTALIGSGVVDENKKQKRHPQKVQRSTKNVPMNKKENKQWTDEAAKEVG